MNIVNSKYYCTACFAQQDPEFAPLFGSTVEVCSWRDARYHVQQLINAPLAPHRFVCKNNGVIFENQLLQIGLKSEYRQNLGEPHSNWTQMSETKSPNDSHRVFLHVLLSQVACTCSTVTRRPPSSSASPRLSPAKTHSRLISSPLYHCSPTRCFRHVAFFFSISNLKTEPEVVAVSPEYWSCHRNPQSGESDCHEQAEQRLAFYWKKYSIEI